MAKVRLAELVGALSLGIDLGFGQPLEHVLRQCLIALRLAERAGLDEAARATVYYAALLVNVGCHTDAHEQVRWFGDDIAFKRGKYLHPPRSLRGAAALLGRVGAGRGPLGRLRVGLDLALSGAADLDGMISRHAAMAGRLAERLGLPVAVRAAVGAAYEQWDGRGWPGDLAGDAIPIGARIASLAEYLEVAHRLGGAAAAAAVARSRRGHQFDPRLADLVVADPARLLDGLDAARAFEAVVAAEPALAVVLSDDEFDRALQAIADFVDLKSPYTLGHSAAVAELAAGAASALGLPSSDVVTLRRAGWVHDFGRLGISNAIWDKPGPLGAGERERVRLHPYLTERMLHQSPALSPLGAIAVQHRERLDGSGYPRGASGAAIALPARILGAADAYQAMREPRPHRPALSRDEAARTLRAEARGGRLAGDIVEAVLQTAGHRPRRRLEAPAGLTAREVEVLRMLARGHRTREIARRLGMAEKTAANHLEHIYEKIGARSRVAAGLFAVQHGLLPAEDE